jgi:hypothetical protein
MPMPKRPSIPAELERQVLLEAGHRCAIHTCHQVPVVVAHIIPWATCKTHAFDNLIALCPTCHSRCDRGEIDRKSMYAYKRRLLSSFGGLTLYELRILRRMKEIKTSEFWILDDLELLIGGLLERGYLISGGQSRTIGSADASARLLYLLTENGRRFMDVYLFE